MFFFLFPVTRAQVITPEDSLNLQELSYAELDSLMYIEYNQSNYNGARVYLQVGLEKSKIEFGKFDSIYAEYSNTIGYMYYQSGQYQQAESYWIEAKKIRAKVLGERHPNYITSVNNLASLYLEIGDYAQAELLFIEAKKTIIAVSGKEHSSYGVSLNNLGNLYYIIGQYEQVEPLYIEAKNIFGIVFGKEHKKYAISANNLAVLYQEMGQFSKAEPLFIEAINIIAKSLGTGHPLHGDYLNNLALLYKNMGQFSQAESLYLESLNIILKVLGRNHPSYSTGLGNLAVLYRKTGKLSQAESLYIEAKNITAKVYGKEHYKYALNLNYLAALYEEMNKLDMAYYYCIESMNANSPQIDSNFTDVENLDKFNFYSNKYLYRTNKILLKVLKSQYLQSRDKSKLELHYKISKAVMRLNERIRNGFSNEGDKLRILRINSIFVEYGIESALLLEKDIYIQEAFSFAEQNKSILLADAVKGNRARALGDLPDSLAEKEVFFQNKKAELKKKQFSARSQEQIDQINHSVGELNLEIAAFLKSLNDKYPKYHALKYRNITANVEDIQALLDEKTLFIEYFQTDNILYLFTVSKEKVELFPLNITKNVLKEKIQQLRYALSSYTFITEQKDKDFRLYTQCAHWFFKELIEIGIQDKSIQNLIIVADGELGHVPFGAFLADPAPQKISGYQNLHYLINDYNISYNYSATLWKENLTRIKQNYNSGMLACAASYSSVDSSLLKYRQPHFFNLRGKLLPLPAAQKEIEALANNFWGDFLLQDSANEHYFKEHAHNYGIIHLAMHGVLDSRTPMLSSLVFSENRDSTEDNFLQAFEIARLKLRADLVVLSACETGYGEFEQGEGVISLARSFMYAGVPSLVVSLWQVNDNSTVQLMTSFYHNLSEGMSKDLALRKAKLSYIKNTNGIMAHPAFWSPFIQLGDSSAVVLATKNNRLWWIVGALLFIIGLGGMLVWKMKVFE